MRISDWSSDVCSSDLCTPPPSASQERPHEPPRPAGRPRLAARRLARRGAGRRVHRRAPKRDQSALQRREGKGRRLQYQDRSEEHTSELQSLMRTSYAVFCLIKKTLEYIVRLQVLQHRSKTHTYTTTTFMSK